MKFDFHVFLFIYMLLLQKLKSIVFNFYQIDSK